MPPAFAHQTQCVAIAHGQPAWAFFLDTGTGKTRAAQEIHAAIPSARSLVVCPLTIIDPAWREDFERFIRPRWPQMELVDLHLGLAAWRRTGALPAPARRGEPGPIVVINYEAFRLSVEALAQVEWGCVFFDESARLKSFQAQVTKAAIWFADQVRPRGTRLYLLSGQPAPNTPLEYWPQMRVIAPEVVGRSFYAHRATYFYPSGYLGHEWKITPERLEKLMHELRRRCVFISKADCLDLPEQLDEVRHCTMTPPQKRAYRQMAEQLVAELPEGRALARNALAKVLRLRQITAGFLRPQADVAADDAGDLTRLAGGSAPIWLSDSKLKALEEIVEETAPRRLLVWTQFHAEVDRIVPLLRRHGATVEITGRISAPLRDKAVRDFRSGAARFLVAHPRCAGHGLTLVECDIAVYFSLSYSLEEYKQSRDRLHRVGQKNRVTYIHLLVPQTIDTNLLAVLRNKGDLSATVLAGLRKWAVGGRRTQ